MWLCRAVAPWRGSRWRVLYDPPTFCSIPPQWVTGTIFRPYNAGAKMPRMHLIPIKYFALQWGFIAHSINYIDDTPE
jgi:hypothetical protein